MIIFFYGPDSFRIHQKTQAIVKKYQSKHKSGLNFKVIDFEDSPNEEELNLLFTSQTMFREKRLLLFKNVFKSSAAQKLILEKEKILTSQQSDIILLIIEGDLGNKKTDKFYQFLIKKAKTQEFKLLEESKVLVWIFKNFQRRGFRFQKGVPERLVEFIGNDLWLLNNELKKLFLYKDRERMITLKDVDLLIKPKMEVNIFRTLDQLVKKDKKSLLEMIHTHLEKGDSPLYLFSMLIFQLRNLLLINEFKKNPFQRLILQESLGLKPFIIKRLSFLEKNISGEELKSLYKKIFELETKIKTGEIEPVLGLDLFVSEI